MIKKTIVDGKTIMLFRSLVLVSILFLSTGAASALAPVPLVQDPDRIRACLCGERQAQTLSERVHRLERHVADLKDRLATLDREIAETRPKIDPRQSDLVDAFRRLLETRTATETTLFDEATPRLSRFADQYNGFLAQYNADCVGRFFNGTVTQSVRENLVCPVLPPSFADEDKP